MATDTNIVWMEFGADLRRFIAGRVGNKADSEDILQDVFCKIHTNLTDLKDSGKISAWVYRITRNTIIDYYRRRPETGLPPEEEAAVSDWDGGNEAAKEIAGCLKSMLEHLPQRYREAIILIEYEGMTQKAVSEKLGLSLPGVNCILSVISSSL